MTHREFDSLLPAYFLGALTPAERARMQRHLLKGCPRCEGRAAGYRRVAAALPLSAAERSPRPELKAELMRRLGPEPGPQRAWWRGPLWAPLAAGLAACAVLAWFAHGARPQAAPVTASASAASAGPRLTLRSGALTQSGHAVAPGGALAWDALLATAADGEAQVQVGGQAVLLLKAGTQVRLSHDGAAVLADLPHGILFSAILPGTVFGVRAGGARVDARGTLFLVRHVSEARAYVCICRGRIQVRAPGLDRQLAAANDAQEAGLNLTLDAAHSLATAAKPAYYTDAEEDGLQDALRDAAEPGAKGEKREAEE